MANKQFRMEEKNWEHQCALISPTMLSKTNMFNFYRKKSLQKKIWDDNFVFLKVFGSNLAPKKLVFGLTLKKMFFFNPIFKYLTTYKNCC